MQWFGSRPRRSELWEDVDLRLGELNETQSQDGRSQEQHDPAEPETCLDDGTHQQCLSVLTGDFEFCAPELDRADGYHLGTGWRARAQNHQVVLVHLFDAHGRTHVGQRPDDREDPGLAFLVINEGGLVHADVGAVGLDESGLELDAVLGLFSEDDLAGWSGPVDSR